MRLAVEHDRAADDRAVAVEAPLPERVAEDGRFRRARRVVARLQRAAGDRPYAEHVEEPIGDRRRRQALGLGAAGQRRRARVVNRDGVRGPVLLAPREEVGVGQREDPAFLAHDAHLHEAIGVPERERSQQHGVDDREDRGRRADAERERQNRDGREARPGGE